MLHAPLHHRWLFASTTTESPTLPAEVPEEVTSFLGGLPPLAGALVVAGLAVLTYVLTRFVGLRLLGLAVRRSETDWDDRFLVRGAPHRLAFVPAALVAAALVGAVPDAPEAVVVAVQRLGLAVVAVSIIWAFFGALDAVNDIYERHEYATSRPIKGYLQMVKLVLAIVTVVLVVAILMWQSPALLLSGLGAATAILLLVFRDTILSLVASIQLATNDMIRVGDWITVDALGVDGDVLDIALHTITFRNFDMSYAFVPTHELIATPFRNWRGMREVEGRRIMRSVHVDVTSIRFLEDTDLDRFADWPLLADEVAERRGTRQTTNLALFRAYALQWLRSRDDLHVDNAFPMMVRLLPPTPSGQPVEVYAFARETAWVPFEAIQSDVFDHLHAMLPAFGLRPYQYLTGPTTEPDERS